MNNILKYTSKDYNSIYKDLIDSIPSLTDLWTNTNDGDPGIVLVKLMSALGDMLSFNLDKQALEYYSPTVTQRKNAAKLFSLIGYHMHWYRSATNTITVTNTTPPTIESEMVINYDKWQAIDGNTYPVEKAEALQVYNNTKDKFKMLRPQTSYPQYYELDSQTDTYVLKPDEQLMLLLRPIYETWSADNEIIIDRNITDANRNLNVYNNDRYESIPYIIEPTTSGGEVRIKPGNSNDFHVIQGTLQQMTFSGENLQNNRFYFIETAINENPIWLSYTDSTSNSIPIYIDQVENLLTVTDGDIHFEFNVDEYDRPYIELSSYWTRKLDVDNTNKLPSAITFTIHYIRTNGMMGNITTNYLSSIEGLPSNNITITHPTNAVPYYSEIDGRLLATPGYNPESAHDAYLNSLNFVTTFDSLVTIFDFERFCKRQEGFTNAFAVDGQRALDLNDKVNDTCKSYTLSQLQAYGLMSSEMYNGRTTSEDFEDIDKLRELFINHKTVYKDNSSSQEFINYQLQMYLMYGDFFLNINNDEHAYKIADLSVVNTNPSSIVGKNKYWLYKIKDIYDVNDSSPIEYLDNKFNEIGVANVKVAYSPIRLFPWRCCGTIHLKAPVTKTVADEILNTVMLKLQLAFSPMNLEFGKQIKYMDVINVVSNAHEAIRYFDAGLGNRKLIDIDSEIDFTYFNDTSLMYYIQRPDNFDLTVTGGIVHVYGNNVENITDSTPNPYYHSLSIAPEYIIEN